MPALAGSGVRKRWAACSLLPWLAVLHGPSGGWLLCPAWLKAVSWRLDAQDLMAMLVALLVGLGMIVWRLLSTFPADGRRVCARDHVWQRCLAGGNSGSPSQGCLPRSLSALPDVLCRQGLAQPGMLP